MCVCAHMYMHMCKGKPGHMCAMKERPEENLKGLVFSSYRVGPWGSKMDLEAIVYSEAGEKWEGFRPRRQSGATGFVGRDLELRK